MEKQNLSKIDALLTVTSRLESSVRFIEEAMRQMQSESKTVTSELNKKTEEIKDAYYLAEMNRQRLVECTENCGVRLASQDKLIEEVKETVKELRRTVQDILDNKDKKIVLIVQVVITVVSVIFGVLVKLGIL